jgi:hypothetical protein
MDRARRKFLVELAEENLFDTKVCQRGPYTHVEVRIRWRNELHDYREYNVEGHGFSKCRPGDPWSGQEGINKARPRAILDAVQQMNLVEV